MSAIADPRIEELRTSGNLPSPSGVALRVMELCRQDDISTDDIAKAIASDPALAGRILRFANSSEYSPRRPVVAINEAVRLIGINQVRQLVLGFSLLGGYRQGACTAFDYELFWSRSLAMAIAAHALCFCLRRAAPDESFTCGLIASIGHLAMATLYPKEYAELLKACPHKKGAQLAEAERQQFALDHNELSAVLLEDWKFPALFVFGIVHHEDPESLRQTDEQLADDSREMDICKMFHLAATIADFCVSTNADHRNVMRELMLGAAKLGLDEETLRALTDDIVVKWRDWGKVLQVKTRDVPKFEDMARELMDRKPRTRDPKASASELAPLKILVIDDDRTIRVILDKLVSGLGHDVISASDGSAALSLAIKERPQVVISDWLMPGMDGLALCKALRQTDEGRHMYFMLVTGQEKDDQLVEAFEAGVDDYVTKPFSPRVLGARLRAAERLIRMQEEARRDVENIRKFAAELAVANRRLQQGVLTSYGTGLPNTLYNMERLERECAASARSGRPLVCMMIKVSCLGGVQETVGDVEKNRVLRELAQEVKAKMSARDFLGDMENGKFLVISTETTGAQGLAIAEQLRVAIEKHRVFIDGTPYRALASIGVAQWDTSIVRAADLVSAAQRALAEAEHQGGNKVALSRAASKRPS